MKVLIIVIITTLFCSASQAQLQDKKIKPLALFYGLLTDDIPSFNCVKLDYNTISSQDEIDAKAFAPPRFAIKVPAAINTTNNGTWTSLSNGYSVWRLAIHCPNATSINLLFSKFHLNTGTALFVYNSSGTNLLGAYTSANNKGTAKTPRKFATGLIFSEDVIVELNVPTNNLGKDILEVEFIGYGYRRIVNDIDLKKTREFQESGDCQVNVNCQEGDDWENERRGVALIIVDGTRWCSGSLINNTCNDGRLLFLTANHCLRSDQQTWDAINNPNADTWSFVWNYESAACANPATEPNIFTTVGATVLANDLPTDFALLELTESPIEANFPVFFNGWDRTNTPAIGGVGIHHPRGDIKKISTYDIRPIANSNCSTTPANFWEINWIATANGHSVQQPGSSGSPVFNNRRIIGQLFGPMRCGLEQCDAPERQEVVYGRLGVSWNNSATAERQLQAWLAPLICTPDAPMTIPGGIFDNCMTTDIVINTPTLNQRIFSATNSIIANSLVGNAANVNLLAANFIQLNDGFNTQSGAFLNAEITPCVPMFIPARRSNPKPISYEPLLQPTSFVIFPNPAKSTLTICNTGITKKCDIRLISMQGVVASFSSHCLLSTNSNYQIDISDLTHGMYIIEILNGSSKVCHKFTKN
jgi:lysyl endopeptidase